MGSGASGITLRAREANTSGLMHFNIQLMSKDAKHLFQKGVYTANVSVTSEMADHFVPWSAFRCSWRGEKVSWCPELTTQLSQVTNIGVGTAFPGKAAKFHVELASISAAKSSSAPTGLLTGPIDLATFDGKAPHTW